MCLFAHVKPEHLDLDGSNQTFNDPPALGGVAYDVRLW